MISFRTDIKNGKYIETSDSKWKTLIAINICLIIMCAAVFAVSSFVVRANAADFSTRKISSAEWYDVAEDGSTLDVFLDGNLQGYEWIYGTSNNLVREKHFIESSSDRVPDNSHDYNFRFISDPSYSGDTVITLQYVKDPGSKPADIRTIPVHVENGVMTVR